ncbi:MAG: uncharacterized protein KVP18_005049 [Porospora cf. gigantea A]|uniref:uncharacterized protein n=1 Tax=Porospora cf. gigantea A TaxID=2853593 RepID=UPI003559D08A|nr:MAG: hypothetical protein KVP18_005049 [Porospora cf. gigantea A]
MSGFSGRKRRIVFLIAVLTGVSLTSVTLYSHSVGIHGWVTAQVETGSSERFFEQRRQAVCSSKGAEFRYESWRHRGVPGRKFEISTDLFNNVIADYCAPSDVGEIRSDRVVAVTAIDAKHFEEAQDLIRSFRTCLPNHVLVMVGMDLPEDMVKKVMGMCNVRYVQFDFEKYPDYVHFIGEYRFKPLVVHNVLFDKWNVVGFKPDAVFWVDSSIRFRCRAKDMQKRSGPSKAPVSPEEDFHIRWKEVIGEADLAGVAWCFPQDYITYYFVPESMLAYIPSTFTDQMERMFGSGCVLVSRAQMALDAVVFWWVTCALDPLCMLDKTAQDEPWYTGNPFVSLGMDIHQVCHVSPAHTERPTEGAKKLPCSRTDQSSLTLLSINAYGRRPGFPNLIYVRREPTTLYPDSAIDRC